MLRFSNFRPYFPVEPEESGAGGAPSSTTETQATTCPVVGIGASAGGLEAFTELLNSLTPGTGMAFVLVQHLDPHHASALVELLARQTSMPVSEASDGIAVERNHVYVIPPNTQITIAKGVLHLTPRRDDRTPFLPIDFFFRSLAEDQHSRAIGIILSGSASDGTLGLKAIKDMGGVTFTQDNSARFNSMPSSAVAAGVADFVLSPRDIARELEGIARHSYLLKQAPEKSIQDGPALQNLLSVIRTRTGIDFQHYKTPTVRRRLARRMAVRQVDTIEAYLDLLETDGDELSRLVDDLLINVTEFFRDKNAFEALSQTAFPLMTKNCDSQEALRIWVIGSSTGEEVYSIAICLAGYLEKTGKPWRVQIFGTDLSEHAIEVARGGRYPESIAASVSQERLRRFFTRIENTGGYQIARAIREQCVFSRHDVTRDPPLARMDLISCRNLLIYMEPVLQKRVFSTFVYALQPKGCLFLGNSESLGSMSPYFIAEDREHKIFRRDLQHPASRLEFLGKSERPVSQPPLRTDSYLQVLDHEADRVLAADYAPSGFLVNSELLIVKFRGNPGRYIAPPSGYATFEVLKLVREELSTPLRLALEEVRKTGVRSRRDGVPVRYEEGFSEVSIVVLPVSKGDQERHYLILFEEHAQTAAAELGKPIEAEPGGEQALAQQLASTRTYLQTIIEELRTVNEEAQSSNEELQSTNEELQTAKEELQSSNEELNTLNEELGSRNRELSQINNDLVNLLSSLRTPIVMLSRDLRIRRFTPSSEKVLNLIPSDTGRPISDLKLRIDVPDLEQLILHVVDSLEPLEREVQDTEGRWYLLRIHAYRTAENRIEGAVMQLLDIDPLKRALQIVEQARDYAEAIIGTVREPLLVLDHELRVRTANRSFFEVFGLSEKEITGRNLVDLGNGPWNFPNVRQFLDAVLRDTDGRIQEVEIEYEFSPLNRRIFQLNARRVKEDDTTGLVLVALEDITDRKRAAESKYRRLFETAKDGIMIVDADSGNVADVNPYLANLFGYSREELVGKPFGDLESLRDVKGARDALRRVRAEEIVRWPDISLQAKDGRGIEVEVMANIYTEGDRHAIQFNVRDITERRQFDQQLQHAAKLESLALLAGGVAHDFNNLLTGIMGNASLALERLRGDQEIRSSLREVVQASQRAADLTRQMLAYAGQGRYHVRPVDFSELVRDITALVKSSIPKQVELELDLPNSLPAVDGDSGQLQQLIMNLVINGAEAIGEGRRGRVRVSTSKEEIDQQSLLANFPGWDLNPGTYVTLEVTDTGAGMDEATRAKIFDPFFTTKFTGRGLGLATALGIVRGHRGGISVISKPGLGSTFKAVFPATQKVAGQAAPEPKAEDFRGRGRILVVDDEEIVLRMTESTLTSYGYEVVRASHGAAAVELVRQQGPELSLVLLDLTMPVMGGAEAWRQIRAMRPDLRVLLSSGYDRQQAVSRIGEPDAVAFIQKPYTAGDLLQTIKEVLKDDPLKNGSDGTS